MGAEERVDAADLAQAALAMISSRRGTRGVVAVVEGLHDDPVAAGGDVGDRACLRGVGGEGLLAEHVLAASTAATVQRPWSPLGSGL